LRGTQSASQLQGAKRPTPTQSTCLYYDHDNEASKCEAPEKGHKTWVGQQGGKTNQGPESQLSMMLHSVRKECSSLLCEAVQGKLKSLESIVILLRLLILFCLLSENRR
jgi:hypothetical protein